MRSSVLADGDHVNGLAVAVLGLRIAYAAGLIVEPERLGAPVLVGGGSALAGAALAFAADR
jgi:hypothetical protein